MTTIQTARPFGPAGVSVPVIGHGTWQMEEDDRGEAIAAIRAAVEIGMHHVDTAELYGDGEVEELVGEAIAGLRDRVFLVSKVMPRNARRRDTIAACERSLRRLRTDHLDCYLLHWPASRSEAPLAETIEAFEALAADGKIRSWGVSNFDDEEIEQAVAIAGPDRVACNQVLYHLGERSIEHRVIPTCARHRIAVVGYSPFGSGDFPKPTSRGGAALAAVADEIGATPRQVALAFLTREPGLFTIPKASRAAHVADNAGALGLALTADQAARVDAAFPRGRARRGVPML